MGQYLVEPNHILDWYYSAGGGCYAVVHHFGIILPGQQLEDILPPADEPFDPARHEVYRRDGFTILIRSSPHQRWEFELLELDEQEQKLRNELDQLEQKRARVLRIIERYS